jgi:putative DNA-binding protein
MPGRAGLASIQEWLQGFIVDPAADEAVISAHAGEADRLIGPSKTLSPVERAGVYRGMYLLRMEEALSSDFPVLKHFLGPDGFMDLVGRYVAAHPSRSYTLNRLRDHLPEFVVAAPRIPRRPFVRDLVRLEQAMADVFDAEGSPVLTPLDAASVPEEAWEGARLRPIAALRLLELKYPADEYLQSVKDEATHPAIRRRDSWLAVYRRDYTVFRLRLARVEHHVLADLVRGATLGEAIRAPHSRRRTEETHLFRWFRRWVSEGLFSAIEPSRPI